MSIDEARFAQCRNGMRRIPFAIKSKLNTSSSRRFQFCGYTGFFLAFVQSVWLVVHLSLSELTLLGITGTVILTFYVVMMVTKVLANGEVIIYYHHEIAVLATSALFLRLTGLPVLPYLDILVLGLGLFLACGRIGCLMVGCCHGRPCRWGVQYGEEHARAGFPHYLVGVKLFPIQAVESILAFTIVICGLIQFLKQHQPGSVLLFYIIAYACGRFCLEFFRGDVARPYFCGFSEAQWTSFVLGLAALLGERARLLPGSPWHPAAVVAMVATMVFVRIRRHFDRCRHFELLHPAHIRQVSLALRHLKSLQEGRPTFKWSGRAGLVHVCCTPLGYRLSMGSALVGESTVEHFSISREGSLLSPRGARTLSGLLARLAGGADLRELIQGNNGVFHVLLVHPAKAGSRAIVYSDTLSPFPVGERAGVP